jgi:hypothetical protein
MTPETDKAKINQVGALKGVRFVVVGTTGEHNPPYAVMDRAGYVTTHSLHSTREEAETTAAEVNESHKDETVW